MAEQKRRGPGRPPKNTSMNAAEAALATIEANDTSREQFTPAGAKAKKVQNTVVLDPMDASVSAKKEVFLIKTWEDGTIYYIDPDHLDNIDRKRLSRALRRANKSGVELWVILRDTKLSNEKNALEYFHQLVRTYRPAGADTAPSAQVLTQRVQRAQDGLIERGGLEDIGRDAPNSLL